MLLVISIALAASVIFAAICLLNAVRVGEPTPSTAQRIQINDFIAQYSGARLAASGYAERIYDPKQLHTLEREISGDTDAPLLPALYPPFFYVMLMPLADLDLSAAYRLWAAVTFFAAILAIYRVAPHWHTLVLGLVFPAVAFSVATGQNGNLSAALIGAGLLLLPFKPAAAGFAFGLLAAYKPQLAVAIPFCLVGGRHYRTLAVMAATVAATILLSLVTFGAGTIISFLWSIDATTQAHFDDTSRHLWQRMPTALAAMLQLNQSKALAWTVQSLAAAGALAGLIYVWRSSKHPTLRALSLVASIPLATPYLFDYDLAILIVPLAFILRDARVSGLTPVRFILVTVLWLIPPFIIFAPATGFWPIAPIVWMLLLAYAALASHETALIGKLAP